MVMLPLTASELAAIRADAAAAACDLPCVIQRESLTRTGRGFTEAWPTISPTGLTAGMTEPTAGQLQNYNYLVGTTTTWQVKLPYGTDVKVKDHLIISGQTLIVNAVLQPRSYAALTTVLAAEVVG